MVIYKERANCGLNCETVGVPQATFRTWLEQYGKHGPMGLEHLKNHMARRGEDGKMDLLLKHKTAAQ